MAERLPSAIEAVPAIPREAHRRSKTRQACGECRRSKRKCDGVQPVCGACSKHPTTRVCVFSAPEAGLKRRAACIDSWEGGQGQLKSAQDVNDSHDTLNTKTGLAQADNSRDLGPHPHEASNSRLRKRPDRGSSYQKTLSANRENVENQALWNRPVVSNLTTLRSSVQGRLTPIFHQVSSAQEDVQPLDDEETFRAEDVNNDDSESEHGVIPLDAMGSVLGNPNSHQDGIYFGSSSTFTFMSQVQDVLGMGSPEDQEERTSQQSKNPHAGHQTSNELLQKNERYSSWRLNWRRKLEMAFEDFNVPIRREADALVDLYWTWVHSLYPFLHKAQFTKRYVELFSSGRDDQLGHDKTSQTDRPDLDHVPHKAVRGGNNDRNFDDILFHSALNLVFALGCQFHNSLNFRERRANGDVFYQRSKRLLELDFDVANRGSVQLVQVMLLMGQYLQSTELSGACWNIVGLAVRVGQSIGLHLDSAGAARVSQVRSGTSPLVAIDNDERELRKRLWGGCVLLDRVLSMTYGRPPMIDSNSTLSLSLPAILDDHILPPFPNSSTLAPDNGPRLMAFYIQALKLHEILGRILATFYIASTAPAPTRGETDECHIKSNARDFPTPIQRVELDDFQSVLKLDAALSSWRAQLPSYLIPNREEALTAQQIQGQRRDRNSQALQDDSKRIFARQANVLQARYLHMQILLFRPLLVTLVSYDHHRRSLDNNDNNNHNTDHQTTSPLQQTLLVQASTMCVTAAQDLSTLISENLHLGDEALPEWWYNVFYIYTSAIALLVGRLSASLTSRIDPKTLQRSWDACLASLRAYQTRSRSARRCARVLELINKRAFGPRCGSEGPRHQHTADVSAPLATTTASTSANANVSGNASTTAATSSRAFDTPDQPDAFLFGSAQDQSFEFMEASWMAEPLDMAWLSAVPFEIEFMETGAGGIGL